MGGTMRRVRIRKISPGRGREIYGTPLSARVIVIV